VNLEQRINAAGRYIRDLSVRMSIGNPEWFATLTTDRIGNAERSFTRYASSPADAIDAVLRDAAEWIQKQRDIR
jgi:hypothetical protein